MSDDDSDFEVAPQQPDEDTDMWNAEDENVDKIKQAKVQRMSPVTFLRPLLI